MAAFEFIALDAKGKQRKGILEADSAKQVRQQLREKAWTPLSVEYTEQKQDTSTGLKRLFARGISVPDLALFTRQLATLIAAGLPVEECLKAVGEQTEKKRIKGMVLEVRAKVLEGHSLAASLNEFDYAFPKLYRATVAAGEHAGHLDLVLNRLADHTENSNQSQREIKTAAIYPIILCLVALGIVAALLTFVVPSIVDVFVKNGQELPTLTKVMIALSNGLQHYGLYILIGLVGGGILFALRLQRPEFRYKWHALLLRVPFLGKMIKGFNTARFASTLAILNSSGVHLVESMRIATQVLGNLVIKERLELATQQVSEGGSLKNALTETKVFPPMMLHMIASGEASGELDQMLERTANMQESDLQNTVTALVRMFEPIMLLVMGGVVMLIVMAIMMPILNMNDMLKL
jgi:general secretion pathway protein F